MPNVNYTISTVPVDVSSNELWGTQDVGSQISTNLLNYNNYSWQNLDGAADSGFIPLKMIIAPNSGYRVNAESFNIAGQSYHDVEVSDPLNGFVWYADQLSSTGDLPIGVNKVTFTNTINSNSVYNKVVVLAWIDPTYTVPISANDLKLDIDGDAIQITDPTPTPVFLNLECPQFAQEGQTIIWTLTYQNLPTPTANQPHIVSFFLGGTINRTTDLGITMSGVDSYDYLTGLGSVNIQPDSTSTSWSVTISEDNVTESIEYVQLTMTESNYNIPINIETCQTAITADDVYGCTNSTAENFNINATVDDGSCYYTILGCTNPDAVNYNANATINDGSCYFLIEGCMDPLYLEYNPNATVENGSCSTLVVLGCMDSTMLNYDANANAPDPNNPCIPFIYGCTDPTAFNYNSNANTNQVDASDTSSPCIAVVEGCTDPEAYNYNASANTNDNSCCTNAGCTDPAALNYDPNACFDDGSCAPIVEGCTNPMAFNYNPNANVEDGSCLPYIYGCTDTSAFNYDPDANTNQVSAANTDNPCIDVILGCTDPTAFNYVPEANTDDGSCIETVFGCTDSEAFNYNSDANTDNGSCVAVINGCTDSLAVNFNPLANTNDNSCTYDIWGCMDDGQQTWSPYPQTQADNYNPNATLNGIAPGPEEFTFGEEGYPCIYEIAGCTDSTATNYMQQANIDDGSCEYACEPIKFKLELQPNSNLNVCTRDYINNSDQTNITGQWTACGHYLDGSEGDDNIGILTYYSSLCGQYNQFYDCINKLGPTVEEADGVLKLRFTVWPDEGYAVSKWNIRPPFNYHIIYDAVNNSWQGDDEGVPSDYFGTNWIVDGSLSSAAIDGLSDWVSSQGDDFNVGIDAQYSAPLPDEVIFNLTRWTNQNYEPYSPGDKTFLLYEEHGWTSRSYYVSDPNNENVTIDYNCGLNTTSTLQNLPDYLGSFNNPNPLGDITVGQTIGDIQHSNRSGIKWNFFTRFATTNSSLLTYHEDSNNAGTFFTGNGDYDPDNGNWFGAKQSITVNETTWNNEIYIKPEHITYGGLIIEDSKENLPNDCSYLQDPDAPTGYSDNTTNLYSWSTDNPTDNLFAPSEAPCESNSFTPSDSDQFKYNNPNTPTPFQNLWEDNIDPQDWQGNFLRITIELPLEHAYSYFNIVKGEEEKDTIIIPLLGKAMPLPPTTGSMPVVDTNIDIDILT